MSGLIEKITLYDLLGYAVPGSILLGMTGFTYIMVNGNMESIYNTYKDAAGYFFLVLLALGYVVGMLMAEIADLMISPFRESLSLAIEDKLQDVDCQLVGQALKRASYIQEETQIQRQGDVVKYITVMYGDIQSDAKYNRLHNYASSKLVCKNLAFVSFFGMLLVLIFQIRPFDGMFLTDSNLKWEVMEMMAFLAAAVLFMKRWRKVYVKTQFYTVIWFMEKYAGKCEAE